MARKSIGYAVIGLGHIAQAAVLPAFANARNSRLVALVSGDERKRRRLAKAYDVPYAFSYDQLEECLALEEVDAVYIALPNTLHAEYAIRAARAGVHVLCEKPMATSERDARAMGRAASENDVQLMVAYRLHFEPANLAAVRLVMEGRIGEPVLFSSAYSFQVGRDNIRLKHALGGGPLWDIGIYCLNAARYLFADEPIEVSGFTARTNDPRFLEVESSAGALLRFPGGRLASFSCSFDGAYTDSYEIVGTRGSLRLENAYSYAGERRLEIDVAGKKRTKSFRSLDQFGPELAYFSDCLLRGRKPDPSAEEGLADTRILSALYRSASIHRPIKVAPVEKTSRPEPSQQIKLRPTKAAELVEVAPPSGD